jgi:hypothetical protein
MTDYKFRRKLDSDGLNIIVVDELGDQEFADRIRSVAQKFRVLHDYEIRIVDDGYYGAVTYQKNG